MKRFSIKKYALYVCLAGVVLVSAAVIWCVSNLWYDPSGQIDREKITVFMERNNPTKYYVDLSFLPSKKQ
jgi:hypothetical protein